MVAQRTKVSKCIHAMQHFLTSGACNFVLKVHCLASQQHALHMQECLRCISQLQCLPDQTDLQLPLMSIIGKVHKSDELALKSNQKADMTVHSREGSVQF